MTQPTNALTKPDLRLAKETQKALRKVFSKTESPKTPKSVPERKPAVRKQQNNRDGSFQIITVYVRQKNAAGKWRYVAVREGRGYKVSNLKGPFYLRYTADGKQTFSTGYPTLEAAREAGEDLRTALKAKARGLTVSELEELTNTDRLLIRVAVDKFLETKQGKAPKTLAAYRLHLNEFMHSLPRKVRFVDEISADVLRGFKTYMTGEGYSGKTIHNRLLTVFFLLKKNGMKNPLPWDEMPVVEEEPAVPFTSDELKTLFAAMDAEEQARYKFFLGTGARDKEVSFAAWQDIDFQKATFHIRRKDDVGFTPKSHESRTVPLPSSLVTLLKERKKQAAHPRWIFVNDIKQPDNHFLRKLKRIALRAGLNCGICSSEITKGKGDSKRKVTVNCSAAPVCQHWYLHRFRKTCATRWLESGLPVRTIQAWLGHKDLTTTVKYLGVADMNDPKVRGQVDKAFGD